MTRSADSPLQRPGTARIADARIMRFAAVGGVTTLLDWVLFSALAMTVGMHPALANLVSYSCGILTSFVLNRTFVFGTSRRDTESATAQFGRFILANAAGLALSTILVTAFVYVLPEMIAKIATVPIVFVWNYSLAHRWVFR